MNSNSSRSPFEAVKCRSSISPIISHTTDAAAVTDTNQEPHNHKGKRRKSHHGSVEQQGSVSVAHHSRRQHGTAQMPKRIPEGTVVTHYAIQLEIFDESKSLNGTNSISSASVAADLLGLNREQMRRQREAVGIVAAPDEEAESRQANLEDEEVSETTEAVEAVTAVG